MDDDAFWPFEEPRFRCPPPGYDVVRIKKEEVNVQRMHNERQRIGQPRAT